MQIIASVQHQTTTIALVSIQQTSITAWLRLCPFTAQPLMEWLLDCEIRSSQRKSILFKAQQMEMTASQQWPNIEVLLIPLSAITQVGPLLYCCCFAQIGRIMFYAVDLWLFNCCWGKGNPMLRFWCHWSLNKNLNFVSGAIIRFFLLNRSHIIICFQMDIFMTLTQWKLE